MHTLHRRIAALLLLALVAPLSSAARVTAPPWFRVTLAKGVTHVRSGRLLIYVDALKNLPGPARDKPIRHVYIRSLSGTSNAVAAMDVPHLAPGHDLLMNGDVLAFPLPFSRLTPGRYAIQAVLYADHTQGYRGRGPHDLVSKVVIAPLGHGSAVPTLVLEPNTTPVRQPWQVSPYVPKARRASDQAMLAAARRHTRAIDFVSPALTAFWGRDIHMRGWVLLPPGYASNARQQYPTVYFTQGYTGTLATLSDRAATYWRLMSTGDIPPMIWVFLDQSSPTGTHEFADSVNNGPWGTALTTELMPRLEATYRMDPEPRDRFLTGHSSGGWAALWLQVRYPKMFGGTWPTSPDPVDFTDFMGPNLYAPHANVYRRPDGTPWPQMRMHGKVIATAEQLAGLERVLGPYGGQDASFEWVFSPRGRDGRPEPLFNRDTGAVDPAVARYWRDHYDIAFRIRTHWKRLKPDLDGKIHLFVGTADTFYLDGPAHKLQREMDRLGANASFHFLPGKTHDVFGRGKDRDWLSKVIAWQMYKVARPATRIPPAYVIDRAQAHDQPR